MTPCFGKSENQDSLQSKYWQHMPQKRNRVWLKSLGFFNISHSRQGHQIILDAVMWWRCKRASNSKVLMVVIFALFSKRWGLFQLSSNTVKNYLFRSWNMYRGNCLRLLIFYTANVASSIQVRRSSLLVLVSDCKKDIKPDNILIFRDDIDESIKCDNLSPAVPTDSQLLPENAILSNPLTVFTPTELANLSEVPKFDVLLTDYGTGKRITWKLWKCILCAYSRVRRWMSHRSYALRAPEVILGGKWGASADVWNLGCLVCLFFILNSSDIETCCYRYLSSWRGDGYSSHEQEIYGLQSNIILRTCREWSEKILMFHITSRRSNFTIIFQKMKAREIDQLLIRLRYSYTG